ncbi:MAG TPA: matrixin family metalloprotease [Gemmatimonadaceae bacterium]|nr:matrixin family metalloprotease [Gemmatimonadaceae bacterium]
MKRAVIILLALSVCATVVAAMRSPAPSSHVTTAVAPSTTETATGAVARAIAAVDPGLAASSVRSEARRRLNRGAAGTYIGEILRERDSSISRWPDRRGKPLAIWIQPLSFVPDFTLDYVTSVRAAFEEWDAVHLPVHFRYVDDSAHADVRVTFIDHFDEPISGRTRWSRDDTWAITDASILLAVHHSHGEQLDVDSMRAMALHEIGHLLGLDHTSDSLSIMAPRVRVRELADDDRATARLLYSLPTGPLR